MGHRVEITPLTDINVRALAEVSSDHDCFISIYLPSSSRVDLDANEAFIRNRVDDIRYALEGEVEREFDQTLASLGEGLNHEPIPGEKGRIVFVSACEDFFESYRVSVSPDRAFVLDNSPYILPLTESMDDHEDYGIILMDSQEAVLYIVRSTIMEKVERSSIDLMNRHKKGGMSQKRFNRLRRGQVDAFVDQVLEDLDRIDVGNLRGLVVAGPGGAKTQLVDALPPKYSGMLLGILNTDMDVRHAELLAHANELARADEVSDDVAAVEALRRAIFKDELGAIGMEETRNALARGRVATLLLIEDLDFKGWICETCKCFSDSPVKCPRCGAKVSPADLVNELVEMAHRTDAAVQHVKDSPFLDSIGGVGAVLRY